MFSRFRTSYVANMWFGRLAYVNVQKKGPSMYKPLQLI